MAGQWFGTTVDNVLRKIQNTDLDVDEVGGQTYVEKVMTDAQTDIISAMPYRNSQPINVGEICGHILVKSANDGQEAIDATQTVPQITSNWHVFINYSGCGTPPNNKGYEATEGTDYTIVNNVPDFTVKPLSEGDRVVANYYTDWSDNYGLEILASILEEKAALKLMENISIPDNADYLTEVQQRRENNQADIDRLRNGQLVPLGLQQMNLVEENEVSDDSKTATTIRIRRG